MLIEMFDLSLTALVFRFVLGLVIGFFIGLTGIGGGVLVLPAMTLLLGMEPVRAVGTTSLFAFLSKISATFHHTKLKTIDWKMSLRFLAGAVPANLATSLWISRQGSNPTFQHGLNNFIVIVVFLSVALMIFNLVRKGKMASDGKQVPSERIYYNHIVHNGLIVLMGAIVGGLLGATSIGGGIIIVPMFIILFNLPAKKTVGSSIFIAVVLTFITSLIYGKGGEVDYATAITMAVGSLFGVHQGSRLSAKMHDHLLQIIVIGLIIVAAILMLSNQGH